MRRPGGTRWSEAESECPLGDRRGAARGKKDEIPKQKRKKQRIGAASEAEAEGFEPPERCRSTVFKTAAIDHSATPPEQLWIAKVGKMWESAKNYYHLL